MCPTSVESVCTFALSSSADSVAEPICISALSAFVIILRSAILTFFLNLLCFPIISKFWLSMETTALVVVLLFAFLLIVCKRGWTATSAIDRRLHGGGNINSPDDNINSSTCRRVGSICNILDGSNDTFIRGRRAIAWLDTAVFCACSMLVVAACLLSEDYLPLPPIASATLPISDDLPSATDCASLALAKVALSLSCLSMAK